MDKVDMEIKKLRNNVDNINRSVSQFSKHNEKNGISSFKNLDEQMGKVSNELTTVQNIITETRTSAIEEREIRRTDVTMTTSLLTTSKNDTKV